MSETAAKDTRNVVERMIAVMGEVGSIGKDRKAPGLNYAFRGIDDITPVVQRLLVKHSVLLTQRVLEREREIVHTSKGTPMISVRLLVEHTFEAPDGSKKICTSLGEALDQMDKATNKANTAALKVTLTTSFTIPVNDPEADTEASPQVEIAHPKSAPRPAAKIPPKVVEAAADEVMREIEALRMAATMAAAPGNVDALRGRYNALQKVMPAAEWTALGEELKARKAELTRAA